MFVLELRSFTYFYIYFIKHAFDEDKKKNRRSGSFIHNSNRNLHNCYTYPAVVEHKNRSVTEEIIIYDLV